MLNVCGRNTRPRLTPSPETTAPLASNAEASTTNVTEIFASPLDLPLEKIKSTSYAPLTVGVNATTREYAGTVIEAESVETQKCEVSGAGVGSDPIGAGTPAVFTVRARDKYGSRIARGGAAFHALARVRVQKRPVRFDSNRYPDLTRDGRRERHVVRAGDVVHDGVDAAEDDSPGPARVRVCVDLRHRERAPRSDAAREIALHESHVTGRILDGDGEPGGLAGD